MPGPPAGEPSQEAEGFNPPTLLQKNGVKTY